MYVKTKDCKAYFNWRWLADISVSVGGEMVKYWNVIVPKKQGNLMLPLKSGQQNVDLSEYILFF